MCFHYAYIADKVKTGNRFGVTNPPEFESVFHANAFANPSMPVITSEEPDKVNYYNWGLVPSWIKSRKDADDISKKTGNARSETVFEKPSYRSAIKSRRCIIPATGFFSGDTKAKKKYLILYQLQIKRYSLLLVSMSTGQTKALVKLLTPSVCSLQRQTS